MIAKPRLLFVDDEPSVLDALRNRLRRERQRWDMAFATSGEQALYEVASNPPDVIVSDMHMPGMDGATLLRAVRERAPGTVRLILSGHAEDEARMRALPAAHMFLLKPCDADHLRSLIERICQMRSLLPHAGLRAATGAVSALSVSASSLAALLEATDHPPHGRGAVVALLSEAPVLAAKVLHLVNSGYLGPPGAIVGLEDAVAFAGVAAIGAYARSEAVFGVASSNEPASQRLRSDARAVARIAAELVRDPDAKKGAFTAGLLCDLGRLLLNERFREAQSEVLRLVREESIPSVEAEARVLGVTHADIGAYTLAVWGLSPAITESVRHHHHPHAAPAFAARTARAVYLADAIITAARGDEGRPVSSLIDHAFLMEYPQEYNLALWESIAGEERRREERAPAGRAPCDHAGESQ